MPVSIEACEGRVELGRMVCAESVYAPSRMRSKTLGMGANSIESGRQPSMLRIRTRLTAGCGASVAVGLEAGVAVSMGMRVVPGVDEGSGAAVGATARPGTWQASARIKARIGRSLRPVFMWTIVMSKKRCAILNIGAEAYCYFLAFPI